MLKHFPTFRDISQWQGQEGALHACLHVQTRRPAPSTTAVLILVLPVYILKRVQILVADLWGCFQGIGLGKFDDIAELTMFADYR